MCVNPETGPLNSLNVYFCLQGGNLMHRKQKSRNKKALSYAQHFRYRKKEMIKALPQPCPFSHPFLQKIFPFSFTDEAIKDVQLPLGWKVFTFPANPGIFFSYALHFLLFRPQFQYVYLFIFLHTHLLLQSCVFLLRYLTSNIKCQPVVCFQEFVMLQWYSRIY